MTDPDPPAIASAHTPVPPDWKLPPGVDRGLWQYLHHDRHAEAYDQYLADSPLAQADLAWVLARCDPARHRLIDLGCGTGRLLEAWSRQGGAGTGVDLSPVMLAQARRKLADVPSIDWIQANLVDLQGVESAVYDRAVCLYSTLGMISPRSARVAALRSFARVSKPGGQLIVHAHNLWANLWHPGGRAFLARCLWQWCSRDPRAGDFLNPIHQGLSGLALHMYSKNELTQDLRQAGWSEIQVIGLDAQGLELRGGLSAWRAAGWLAIATKP